MISNGFFINSWVHPYGETIMGLREMTCNQAVMKSDPSCDPAKTDTCVPLNLQLDSRLWHTIQRLKSLWVQELNCRDKNRRDQFAAYLIIHVKHSVWEGEIVQYIKNKFELEVFWMVKQIPDAALTVTLFFIRMADLWKWPLTWQGNLSLPKWEALKDYTWSQRKLQGDCYPSTSSCLHKCLHVETKAKPMFCTCFVGKV